MNRDVCRATRGSLMERDGLSRPVVLQLTCEGYSR